jgi:hypothetical protein
MWNDWCIKYRSYQLAGDNGGMQTILDAIKNYYNLATNAQALQMIVEHCNRYFPGFHWELPSNPEAQIDCYDCRGQIMQRYMAVEGCPEGWIASPVNASTGVSKNPCPHRNTTSGPFSRFGEVNFYDKKTGRSVGDAVLKRSGSFKGAAAKKIGSTMPRPQANKYRRLRQKGNGTTLSKGYPINRLGMVEQPNRGKGYPINSHGIIDRKGMASENKGYPINSFGINPHKKRK